MSVAPIEIVGLEHGKVYDVWIEACNGNIGCYKSISQREKVKCELQYVLVAGKETLRSR